MKKLFTLALLTASVTAHAGDTRFLLPESDGMKLANILLLPSTQKCLTEKGFRGVDLLTDARKAMIDDDGDATTYTITVDEYEILPTDGRALKNVKDLTISVTKKLTREGSFPYVECSFEQVMER